MAKICFVVHRYAPYPGGSEVNVQNMAEEMLRRGHEVTVIAHTHQGDLNGVSVTGEYSLLTQKWDLIICHGGDVISQDIVHRNATLLKSPILYLIIKPSDSMHCAHGMKMHNFIGYGTTMDISHIKKYGVVDKARRVRYGIKPELTIKDKNPINGKTIFVSAGGYYPHKAMVPLAEAFEKANIPNAELHLYGYGEGPTPKSSDKVIVHFGDSKDKVMQAMANADAYIMNSYEEGFGLVLLESMMNHTPWFARDIAGAHDMKKYGTVYNDEKELMDLLKKFKRNDRKVEDSFNYVMANHTIQDTCNDLDDIIVETF
jgi:glycosyltransferase involved in cell wall biosynthesis